MNPQFTSLAVELPDIKQLGWSQRRLIDRLMGLRRGRLRIRFGESGAFDLCGGEAGPSADITIHRSAALLKRLFWRGDLGFGESFMAGDWTSSDPAPLLELFAVNLDDFADVESRHWLVQGLVGLQHWLNRNSRRGSRRNIAAHYDLGNDFYRQWLDTGMTYSAAVFSGAKDLREAQERKYANMLDLVGARPGDRILEIGCGWGGFAEHAARHGIHVVGLTLSCEQLAFASARIAAAGLGDLVDLRLCDYRDFNEPVDHIVSIEMFEAVGCDYWNSYFTRLSDLLRPGGRAALQVITIDEGYFDQYAANPGGFIQTYIFPGGMLPTKRHLQDLGRSAGLSQTRSRDFGRDYAETLGHWHAQFQRCTEWMERHGYDERFRRMWRYYLAFCEAGFRARQIDVVQCAFVKG